MKLQPPPFPEALGATAFAFRGYDVANLGRTPELLAHAKYGPIVEAALIEGSKVCASIVQRPVDLVERVRRREETPDLSTYAEDIALIVSVSLAQIRILDEQFGGKLARARLAFGYSLGEASALIAAHAFRMEDLLRVPLAMASDCVALAQNCTMGVLFLRGASLDRAIVDRLCREINQQGDGVIGVSTILSPNCMLLLGQNATVDRFSKLMKERLAGTVSLRKNPHRWPPLHTSITWQKAIPNRVSDMLHSVPGGISAPSLPILLGVTGKADFTVDNGRDLLSQWVDHPQRLWDQVVGVLSAGVRTVVHVGPSPNLIPATFKRLAEGVRSQLQGRSAGSFGKRVVSSMVHRPWLAQLLPTDAVLLRAPTVHHIVLEDWLLDSAEQSRAAHTHAQATAAVAS